MGGEEIIRVEGLVAGYEGHVVLEGVDFGVGRGESVALLGASGSGKSTLLNTILGLKPPMSGRVWMFGEEVYRLDEAGRDRLRRRYGAIFQTGALFGSLSVGEGIALVLREFTELDEEVVASVVRMKLALVGLRGMEGRRPSELSGGQRKRAAVARAMALDPELLLCDEPSAGLDPIVAAGLDEVLRGVQRLFGTAMVVVTHELASVRAVADRVVMLHDGRVAAVGTVAELEVSPSPTVRDFFARRPPSSESAGASAWRAMGGGGEER